jgi:hypothetical protein
MVNQCIERVLIEANIRVDNGKPLGVAVSESSVMVRTEALRVGIGTPMNRDVQSNRNFWSGLAKVESDHNLGKASRFTPRYVFKQSRDHVAMAMANHGQCDKTILMN